MFNYILNDKQGRFLLIGTILTIIATFVSHSNEVLARYIYYVAIFFLGYHVTKNIIEEFIVEKSVNVDLLMILSVIGAIFIKYESEGAILLIIFGGSEVLSDYVSQKSSKSIEELMNHLPDKAKVLNEDGSTREVPTSELNIGDIVLIAKGDNIPIDGYADHDVVINEASLTGESVPVSKSGGEEVFAGTINEGEAFKLEVSKTADETVFSNIIHMVEQAQNNPSKKQNIIRRIGTKYVVAVLIAVPLFVLGLMYISNYSFQDAFYRGIVLLTVASPCALVASATPATLSAISNAAKNGILFKDSKAIESLKDINIIASDKTGTLTYGEFEVVDYKLDDELLKQAIYIEQNSNHPIAKAIVNKFKDIDIKDIETTKVEEIPGIGLSMGDMKIGNLSKDENLIDEFNYKKKYDENNTVSLVSYKDKIVGYFVLSDRVRESSKTAINSFKNNNVIFEMLTGDNKNVAKKISEKLGISHFRAELLPQDKMDFIKEKQSEGKEIAMIGDGINDAPALANADIGISMGSGSSIAMESSDLVVVQNDLSKIYHSYELSKKLNTIIYQNISFAIGVIVILIILNIIGILDLPLGVVFHEGSTIMVILNGLRLLRFKSKR